MKTIIAKNFNQIAKFYNEASCLHQEIAARLLERLELIKISPKTILDLGSGTGNATTALSSKYPNATLISLDISENMLAILKQDFMAAKVLPLCADGENIPLNKRCIDFVFSNAFLQYFLYPQNVLESIYQILKPNGLFLFTTFGPNTLKELREAFLAAQIPYPIQSFIDMHDLGDLLVKIGFQDPVLDTETLTLTYNSLSKLAEDLLYTEGHPISLSKEISQAYTRLYEKDGILPATFEVVYGLGFMPSNNALYTKDSDGVIRVAADNIPILK